MNKAILSLFLSCLFILSCSSILPKQVVETVTMITDLTKEFKGTPFLPDSTNKIISLDTLRLSDLLKNGNSTNFLIHFWGTWDEKTVSELEKIAELSKTIANKKIILICCDIDSKAQKELVRKFLFSKGIYIESYLIKKSSIDIFQVIEDFKTHKDLIGFIKYFDKEFLFNGLPVTYILDTKGVVINKIQGLINLTDVTNLLN
jgi:thiol-disulfide isomerase/thioredoxin